MTERKKTAVERLAEDDAERELEARELAWAVEHYTRPAPAPPSAMLSAEAAPAPAPAAPAPPVAVPSLSAPEYLSTKQAAALLGVSVKHLETLRARGKPPPYVRLGRAIRYPRATLTLAVPRTVR